MATFWSLLLLLCFTQCTTRTCKENEIQPISNMFGCSYIDASKVKKKCGKDKYFYDNNCFKVPKCQNDEINPITVIGKATGCYGRPGYFCPKDEYFYEGVCENGPKCQENPTDPISTTGNRHLCYFYEIDVRKECQDGKYFYGGECKEEAKVYHSAQEHKFSSFEGIPLNVFQFEDMKGEKTKVYHFESKLYRGLNCEGEPIVKNKDEEEVPMKNDKIFFKDFTYDNGLFGKFVINDVAFENGVCTNLDFGVGGKLSAIMSWKDNCDAVTSGGKLYTHYCAQISIILFKFALDIIFFKISFQQSLLITN